MNRRTLIGSMAATLATALAGCSGGDGGGETTTAESTPTPSPTPTPTEMADDDTPTDAETEMGTDTATATGSSGPAQVVDVGPDGTFSFAPESFEISTGDTVEWVWRSGGHNVKADTTPDGSDWSGTPGGEFDTFESGHRYSHTFETAGEYSYVCAPHEGAGMTGSFTVTE